MVSITSRCMIYSCNKRFVLDKIRDSFLYWISPKILTRGGIQGERNWNNKDVPIFLFF